MSDKKWQQVYNDLLRRIESGVYPVGSRFPSVSNLCRFYDPSNITIRRACRELKRNGWITTRGQQGTFVTEPMNELKIYLCDRNVSQMASDLSFPHWRFESLIQKYRTDMEVAVAPVSTEYAMKNPGSIKGPMVTFFSNFLDLSGTNFRINHERIAFFRENFTPLVFGSPNETYGLHRIWPNRHKAFRQIVHYLADKGHRRIAYLAPMLNIPGEQERFRGYLDGMMDCGFIVSSDLVRTLTHDDYSFVDDAMAEILSFPNPPTAVICASDRRALNVLNYCRKHGIKVPEDLAVTGFDNSPKGAEYDPPLTTFASLPDKAGHYIMDYVKLYRIGQMSMLLNYEIEPQFIERGST